MTINYNAITDVQKLEVADILSKIESIEAALIGIQSQRVDADTGFATKEQELLQEKNTLLLNIRKIRKATLVA